MRKFLLVCLVLLNASCAVSNHILPTKTTSTDVNALKDDGFISQEPCGPPCFYGITPGIATDADVEQARQNLGNMFTDCNIFDNTSSGAGRGMTCAHNLSVAYDKQIVEGIGFAPWRVITAQDVIDKYGPPDQVNVFIVSLPDSPFKIGVNLSYDRLQTVLALPEQLGREYDINPSSTISQVAYYAKSKYQELRDATSSSSLLWHGFGIYHPAP